MNMIPFLLKIHYIYLYIHIHAYDGNMWGEAINFLFLRSIGIGFRGYFTLCHIFLSFLKVFTNIYISIMLLWISEKQNVTPEVGLAREYQPSSHEFLRGTPEPFWSAGCQSALVSGGGREQPHMASRGTCHQPRLGSPGPHFTKEPIYGHFPSLMAFLGSYIKDRSSSRSENFTFGMSHSTAKNHLSEVLPTYKE